MFMCKIEAGDDDTLTQGFLIMMHNDNTMSVAALSALLGSTVHVLGDMNADGSNLRIQNGRANYGTPATPFFSSQQEVLQSVDAGQSVLSMSARELFELLPGVHFVLNPRSAAKQEFPAELIKQLLDGSYSEMGKSAASNTEQATSSFGSRFRSILKLHKPS